MAYDARVNGAPAKADERHAAVQIAAYQPDRRQDVFQRFARLEAPEPAHVVSRPHGTFDGGTLALDEVERYSQRVEREQQIREQDGGVDIDPIDRLQRYFRRQLRLPADLQQRSSRARIARYSDM